ncbi:MAG: cell wall-binding repeat-containing protein, partial [Anaerovoracaceae bacterium]|nr:cell wall-binding repeat-containing protein [Anaerovoracaceae bacterium]
KKGDILSFSIMVYLGRDYKFDADENLVIKYNGVQVKPMIGRYSDRHVALWGLIPPVMIGNDPADKIERLAGANRFKTAFLAADALKEKLKISYGREKFANAVIASGINFPDALAGAYLAGQKGAPLLLASAAEATNVADYIKKNMEEDGTVYILGGEVAVPADMEAALTKAGIKNVKRLKGDNRYLTNLEILKEAGVDYEDLLVCAGGGYADSLSASATGRPVLLVGNKLLPEQKEYLESIKDKFSGNVYAIGGEKVVTNDVFKEVCAYAKGEKERLAGSNRYLTSKAVADKFFQVTSGKVVLAYAQNYPDGLAGGPLAYYMNAPLLLVDTNHIDAAKEYAAARGAVKCIVLGGPGLISDQAALAIVS